jgi:hypothetical protein
MTNMTRVDFIISYPDLIKYLINRNSEDIINEIVDIILRVEDDNDLDNISISVKNMIDISMGKNGIRIN